MTPVVHKRPKAEQDLLDIYTYIGERNSAAAERFLDAAESAFAMLARFPKMGRPWKSDVRRLADVRSWAIPRFQTYRIFYRPLVNGIEVLHIFHGARDIQALLESEEDE